MSQGNPEMSARAEFSESGVMRVTKNEHGSRRISGVSAHTPGDATLECLKVSRLRALLRPDWQRSNMDDFAPMQIADVESEVNIFDVPFRSIFLLTAFLAHKRGNRNKMQCVGQAFFVAIRRNGKINVD